MQIKVAGLLQIKTATGGFFAYICIYSNILTKEYLLSNRFSFLIGLGSGVLKLFNSSFRIFDVYSRRDQPSSDARAGSHGHTCILALFRLPSV